MGNTTRNKFKNMLSKEVYRQVFKQVFRIPKYGKTRKVPFELNPMQELVLEEMDFSNIILKARKEGFSTLILAIAIINCNEMKNYHAVFLADNEKNTKAIFRRVEDIIKNAVNFDSDEIDIQGERIIWKRTNSYIEIATAGRKSAFRGSDIHFIHLSEVAFFQYPDVYEAVLEARAAGAIVFFESTANGRNMYCTLWNKAKTYPEGSNFKPFFFGWNLHPEYTVEALIEQNVVAPSCMEGFTRTSEEKEYCQWAKDVHDIILTDERLFWKRWKLKDMPNPEKFPQEYPLTAAEAFLSSGNPVFNQRKLGAMTAIAPKYRTGSIDLNRRGELSWVDESKNAYWTIFIYPQPGKEYVIGGDTAEGVDGGDFNAAYVLDPETWEQVAEFHGLLDPDQFAYELNKGGRYYNDALLAVERNMHGYTVNSRLFSDYEYPRLYQEEKDADTMMVEPTMNYGFRTNVKTRPLMVDVAKRYIRQGAIKINSIPCIDECLSFIINPVGKAIHDVGMHDDRVFAMMIALYVTDKYPEIRKDYGLAKRFKYHDHIKKYNTQNVKDAHRGGY